MSSFFNLLQLWKRSLWWKKIPKGLKNKLKKLGFDSPSNVLFFLPFVVKEEFSPTSTTVCYYCQKTGLWQCFRYWFLQWSDIVNLNSNYTAGHDCLTNRFCCLTWTSGNLYNDITVISFRHELIKHHWHVSFCLYDYYMWFVLWCFMRTPEY